MVCRAASLGPDDGALHRPALRQAPVAQSKREDSRPSAAPLTRRRDPRGKPGQHQHHRGSEATDAHISRPQSLQGNREPEWDSLSRSMSEGTLAAQAWVGRSPNTQVGCALSLPVVHEVVTVEQLLQDHKMHHVHRKHDLHDTPIFVYTYMHALSRQYVAACVNVGTCTYHFLAYANCAVCPYCKSSSVMLAQPTEVLLNSNLLCSPCCRSWLMLLLWTLPCPSVPLMLAKAGSSRRIAGSCMSRTVL